MNRHRQFIKRTGFLAVILAFMLVLAPLVLSQGEESASVYDPSKPGEFDYAKGSEQDKMKYLEDVYGVKGLPSGLAGVTLAGDQLIVSNSAFTLNGANFQGGTVKLGKGGELLSVQSTEVKNDLSLKGSVVTGIFSFSGNSITIEKGKLALGNDASSQLTKVTARKGTTVDVSRGTGYTGTITAEQGPFNLGTTEQQVSVGKSVAVKDGKIDKGESITAVTPVKGLFAGIPDDLEVSMTNGKVDGNTIESSRYCLSANCFSSKDGSAASKVEITKRQDEGDHKLTITGTNVRYRWKGELQRIISSPNGATLEQQPSQFLEAGEKWRLTPGTTVTEVKAGGASSTISVSKETLYSPRGFRDDCNDIPGSCIAIDQWNSVRVKVQGNNKITVNNFMAMPTITVDKIDDQSTVEYIEHNLDSAVKEKDKVKLKFSKDPLQIYPAANLKHLQTRVFHEYTGRDDQRHALELDTAGKSVAVDGKILGHYDEWVQKNYYRTRFSDVISQDKKREIEDLIHGEIPVGEYAAFTEEQKDALIILTYNNPEAVKGKLQPIGFNIKQSFDKLPKDLDKGEFLRKASTYLGGQDPLTVSSDPYLTILPKEAAELEELYSQMNIVSGNYILEAQVLDAYQDGKISNAAVAGFTKRFLADGSKGEQLPYSAEEAQVFVTVLTKVPTDKAKVDQRLQELGNVDEFYQKYHQGNARLALFDTAGSLLETGRITIHDNDLAGPPSLQGKVPQFIKTWSNWEIMEISSSMDLGSSLLVWEHEPELVKVAEGWSAEKGGLTSVPQEFNRDVRERIEVLKALAKARNNPALSEDLRFGFSVTFASTSSKLGTLINHLGHVGQEDQRGALVEALPSEVQLEILNTRLSILGEDEGLYTSSVAKIFKSLTTKVGGGEHFVDFMEKQGEEYKLGGSHANNILLILAASGQLGEVVPADPARRKMVYSGVIGTFIDEHPSLAAVAIRQILSNANYKDEFSETFLQEYVKAEKNAAQSKEDATKRNVFQFIVRQNLDKFNAADPTVASIVRNPSPAVQKVEASLNIPAQRWIQEAEKKTDGTPVIRHLVGWVNTEDKNEEIAYKQYKTSSPGYLVVSETDTGYVLEKRGTIVVVEEGKPVTKNVVFQKVVTKSRDEFVQQSRSEKYQLQSCRGHSYGCGAVAQKLSPADVNIFGSCGGVADFDAMKSKNPSAAYIGTTKTGLTDINDNLDQHIESSFASCSDYKCSWDFVTQQATVDIEDRGYVGPVENIYGALNERREESGTAPSGVAASQ